MYERNTHNSLVTSPGFLSLVQQPVSYNRHNLKILHSMATEVSGGSSFKARVLDSISVLSSSFDAKLAVFKEQLMEEQKMENDCLTKKLKLEKKF